MKKCMIAIIFLSLLTFSAFAEENLKIMDEYIELYGEELESSLNDESLKSLTRTSDDFDAKEALKSAIKGDPLFSVMEVIKKILEILFAEIKRTLRLLAIIPIVAVLNTYISGMQKNFKTKGTLKAAFFTCYTVMMGVAAAAFIESIECARVVVENVSVFMRTLIPVSLASLMSSGAVISATTFEAVLITVIGISDFAAQKFFMPLIMMSAALSIANNLSDFFNVEKLVALMNKFVKWGMGLLMTVFVGITGLQGIAASSADGLSVKITKFAASNVIPIVGGILSETVETVMNCSVVIKNAVGIVGIIILIGIVIVPLLKMAACLILFRVCAAAIQPISDERYVKSLTALGDSVSSAFALSVSVVVMFVIILTIIINIGNTAFLFGK